VAGILPAVSGGILAARSTKPNPRHNLASASDHPAGSRRYGSQDGCRYDPASNPRLDTRRFIVILPRSVDGVFDAEQAKFEFMKRQYQPSKIRRKRQHGFLNRNSSKSGKATLRNRRREGRKRLTPV
jgi:large subunit ribosomal protein L34